MNILGLLAVHLGCVLAVLGVSYVGPLPTWLQRRSR